MTTKLLNQSNVTNEMDFGPAKTTINKGILALEVIAMGCAIVKTDNTISMMQRTNHRIWLEL